MTKKPVNEKSAKKPATKGRKSAKAVEASGAEDKSLAKPKAAKRASKATTKTSSKASAKKRKQSAGPAEVESQTVSAPEISYPTVNMAELEHLLTLTHYDPHSVLGAHPTPHGVIVRAFRPDALSINLLIENSESRAMVKAHPAGLFELLVRDRNEVFAYKLEVIYPNGSVFTQRDSYAYLPTLGDFDTYLFNEGKHERVYDKLGAHLRDYGEVRGVSFAVWAPTAQGVSVVGNFNSWDGRLHQMRKLGGSGIWELFIPDLGPGELYKYEIHARGWLPFLKADPYAFYTEVPPATSSIVYESKYEFKDQEWIERRAKEKHWQRPLAIYEAHLGSWRRVAEDGNRPLTYREIAPVLADYILEMGFTHVEFLPLKEHPYGGSWGYQVSAYYAPSSRYGTPDDFRYLVDYLHQRGIGVIMDWVPAHFPKDAFALGRFDGSALYEHLDPRKGEHPDWGTYIFNYDRNEVRNFLLANALYWIEEFHIDALRVDAVASMLYLDYSRSEGQWIPNQFGGRENLAAISLLREINDAVHARGTGAVMIAEESTAWPGVSHPTSSGGLGFDFKWNMGWMHDTLQYFQKDPIYRYFHHGSLTFGLIYAWSEHFILPFSHDEVVHGKGALLNKMPGDQWQKFANLRALYAYMWAHPGKKLLFMGGELGQWREWNEEQSLDWHLLEQPHHKGVHSLVRDLNKLYAASPSLWEADSEPAGFQWIDPNDAPANSISFIRIAPSTGEQMVCVCNFSTVVREDYRIGLPRAGEYREILNTDAEEYGGSGVGNKEAVTAEEQPSHGQPFSAPLTVPPLATVWFSVPDEEKVKADEEEAALSETSEA
ncbi:MAG: 1,4-alpha-glucan branching protein GlgB [Pyrinomonadaceae bacterium]